MKKYTFVTFVEIVNLLFECWAFQGETSYADGWSVTGSTTVDF